MQYFVTITASVLFAAGMFFILLDLARVPDEKAIRSVLSLKNGKKKGPKGFDVFAESFAVFLASKIRMNEFKRAALKADLLSAQMDISPEMYKANAIIKALIIAVFAIPFAFILPAFCPFVLILAVVLYSIENKSVEKQIGIKRRKIEFELPRFVFTIEKTLKHSRDVLYMIESYSEHAGPEMRHELSITAADIRSGNHEAAITRLEGRVGSPGMSDVCRGLISIIRGDETAAYWASLAVKLSDAQRQVLRYRANKVPGKVRRLSICLLICFMLIYAVVFLFQILGSIGVLFG